MAVKAVKVERRGSLLVVQTQAQDNQGRPADEIREYAFASEPPPPPSEEELTAMREGNPEAVPHPDYPAVQLTPEAWVRQCAEEAVRLHEAHLNPPQPEPEDLTHLLG